MRKPFMVRLGEEEKGVLEGAARAAGKPLAEWMREVAMGVARGGGGRKGMVVGGVRVVEDVHEAGGMSGVAWRCTRHKRVGCDRVECVQENP